MRLSLIVAMSENRLIGRDGALPWRLSDDLRRFKRLTMGHPIVMGRKTYDSIGRPLPGRISVVVSRHPHARSDGLHWVSSLEQALHVAANDDEAFIIGGAQIYQIALPRVERLYVTLVHARLDGDRWFPEIRDQDWTVAEESFVPADSRNEYDHTFRILDRARQSGP